MKRGRSESPPNNGELIAAYVPVIQQGYVDLFDRHPNATIGVFDTDILEPFSYLKKDIRALRPDVAVRAIEGMGYQARFLGKTALRNILTTTETPLTMPDDDVSHGVISAFAIDANRVTLEPVFLRWDRENTKANVDAEPDARIDIAELEPSIVGLLAAERNRSTNMWRHVAAVAAHGSAVIGAGHNRSLPGNYTSVIDGDPRNTAKRGEAIDLSNDVHAESELIASAARAGNSLKGADLYVTTFPCPNCAKLIAVSQFKRCFYAEGYAMLDGQDVLHGAGVELIKIDGLTFEDDPNALRPYPPAS